MEKIEVEVEDVEEGFDPENIAWGFKRKFGEPKQSALFADDAFEN